MSAYLILSAALFAIGAYGVLARRNLIIVLMSLELMLNGVNIALVTFSLAHAGSPAAVPHGHVRKGSLSADVLARTSWRTKSNSFQRGTLLCMVQKTVVLIMP